MNTKAELDPQDWYQIPVEISLKWGSVTKSVVGISTKPIRELKTVWAVKGNYIWGVAGAVSLIKL